MPLGRRPAPFDDPNFLLEVKWDGFRALAHVKDGVCRLVSRNQNAFKSFPDLCRFIAGETHAREAILDGEIVCLDSNGKPTFRDVLFRRGNRAVWPSILSGTTAR